MPVPKGFHETAAEFPLSKCHRRSIRVKIVSPDLRFLVCCAKNRWNAKTGRCRVGTRRTRIQRRVR